MRVNRGVFVINDWTFSLVPLLPYYNSGKDDFSAKVPFSALATAVSGLFGAPSRVPARTVLPRPRDRSFVTTRLDWGHSFSIPFQYVDSYYNNDKSCVVVRRPGRVPRPVLCYHETRLVSLL